MAPANIYRTLCVRPTQSPKLVHFTSEVDAIFVPILWMRKLRPEEVERLGQVS